MYWNKTASVNAIKAIGMLSTTLSYVVYKMIILKLKMNPNNINYIDKESNFNSICP